MKNIIESFVSIQGEGLRTGFPSLFVRLYGCNLRCVFHDVTGKFASACDTNYASFGTTPIGDTKTDEFVCEMLRNNPGVSDVVITGGEPLLNQPALVEFIKKLREVRESEDIHVTIETNGSIEPTDELLKEVDLWSVSPKLNSSVPTPEDAKTFNIPLAQCKLHDEKRINVDALSKIVSEGWDCQLKFVYSGPDCIEEIESLRDAIQQHTCERVNDFIMLMPEGITEEAILGKSDEVVKVCIEKGWTFSSRMHILIWGNVKEK